MDTPSTGGGKLGCPVKIEHDGQAIAGEDLLADRKAAVQVSCSQKRP